jgi:hypothetical protein
MSFYAMDVFIGVLSALALILVLIAIAELFFDVRAEPKAYACEARQMEARRFTLTDSVVCVPVPTRRDTLSVEQI